jgi:hypothetical protein
VQAAINIIANTPTKSDPVQPWLIAKRVLIFVFAITWFITNFQF